MYIYIYIYISTYLSIYLSIYLSLSFSLSISLSLHIYIYIYIYIQLAIYAIHRWMNSGASLCTGESPTPWKIENLLGSNPPNFQILTPWKRESAWVEPPDFPDSDFAKWAFAEGYHVQMHLHGLRGHAHACACSHNSILGNYVI